MSLFANQQIFGEAAGWNVWDRECAGWSLGPHGQLGMSMADLLEEMSSFYIQKAVAAHGTGVEYDAAVGNEALARTSDERLIPAWIPLPDRESIEQLARRKPQAVRLMPKNLNHSYPLTAWGAGQLLRVSAIAQRRHARRSRRHRLGSARQLAREFPALDSCASRYRIPFRSLHRSIAEAISRSLFRQRNLSRLSATGKLRRSPRWGTPALWQPPSSVHPGDITGRIGLGANP